MSKSQTYEIISLCKGMSCTLNGSEEVHDELELEIEKRALSDKIEIVESCCKGMCEEGPNATLLISGEQKNGIEVDKVKKIIDEIENCLF
ncbi:MAG TPA: hypothetical protein DEP20_02305 [Fusobacteria bacterium]|nr:hypothetical protein [Fusobacteriota bacterium]